MLTHWLENIFQKSHGTPAVWTTIAACFVCSVTASVSDGQIFDHIFQGRIHLLTWPCCTVHLHRHAITLIDNKASNCYINTNPPPSPLGRLFSCSSQCTDLFFKKNLKTTFSYIFFSSVFYLHCDTHRCRFSRKKKIELIKTFFFYVCSPAFSSNVWSFRDQFTQPDEATEGQPQSVEDGDLAKSVWMRALLILWLTTMKFRVFNTTVVQCFSFFFIPVFRLCRLTGLTNHAF